jgi:hypothetical protein
MVRCRTVWLSLCVVAVLAAPVAAQVSPAQGPPGTRVTLTTAPCTIDKGPQALFGDTVAIPTPAASATPPNTSWTVTVPPLAAQPFAVKFRCGTTDAVQIGVFTVQPVVPLVTGVWSDDDYPPKAGKDPTKVLMGESIVVKVEQLKRWRAASTTNQSAPLRLYLAGVLVKNVTLAPTMAPPRTSGENPLGTEKPANPQNPPVVEAPDIVDASYFLARLEMDDAANDVHKAWAQALGVVTDKKGRDIPVSVGTDAEAFPTTEAAKIQLEVYPQPWAVIVWLIAIALGLGLAIAAFASSALRDPTGAKNPPFSLARTQMAAWFYVIVVSYLFLWLVTGTAGAPSSTALTLMGISGATGLVATTMDRSKRQQAKNERAELEREKAALDAELAPAALPAQLAAAGAGTPAAATLTTTIQQKTARQMELATLLAVPAPAPQASEDPLKDVLSDENGVTVHRLQMLTWTIVLIVVFVHGVLSDLVMPVFDATLLGLMGISAGAYLGFKFPEPAP